MITQGIYLYGKQEAEEWTFWEQVRWEQSWRDQTYFVPPYWGGYEPSEEEIVLNKKAETVAKIAKEHPEDAARIISMLILENPTTQIVAIIKEFQEHRERTDN